MSFSQIPDALTNSSSTRANLDRKLAAYLAASSSASVLLASVSEGAVVSNTTLQPFGVNEEVSVDFNGDGQIDFQIDHDRVDLNGTMLDYLQIDKNDISSAANPIPIDGFAVFPVPDGQGRNYDHSYMATPGDDTSYPLALAADTMIGPSSEGWLFQESDNYTGSGITVRANRLIDEDHGQIDANAGGTPQAPSGMPGWVGLSGDVRYLGVRIDLQDAGFAGNAFPFVGNGPGDVDDPANYWYGWIGVRITDEASATGEVVGYAYESQLGVGILAGDTGPALTGDYDLDGDVDGADFLAWQQQLGSTVAPSTGADGNGNGLVDAADLTIWQGAFASSTAATLAGAQGSAAAVPEPGSMLMAATGGALLLGSFLRRRVLPSCERLDRARIRRENNRADV